MTNNSIRRIVADEIQELSTVEEFLRYLGGSTWIFFQGKSSHSCRLITTLLHGNEPSGCDAILRLIKENFTPVVDTWVLIASVDTALVKPVLTRRFKTGSQDLNRCFESSWKTDVEVLAKEIIKDISNFQPEAIIDVHNTSGAGPGFCVATSSAEIIGKLAGLFSNSLIITHIKLGALMEIDFNCPILTVECGGNESELSHLFAYNGINKFLSVATLSSLKFTDDLHHYLHPLRLELKPGCQLTYGNKYHDYSDITLCHSIEHQNFGTTVPEKRLGWLGSKGLDSLQLLNSRQQNMVEDYFENRQGEFCTKQHLHLFMVTKNRMIAETDCLFYVTTPD